MPIMRTKSPVVSNHPLFWIHRVVIRLSSHKTEREAVMVAASNHTEAPRPVSMNPTSLNFASEGNVPKNTPISESARVGAQPPPRPARVKSQPFRAQGAVKLPPRNLKHRTDMTNAQNGSNSSSTAWSNGLSKAVNCNDCSLRVSLLNVGFNRTPTIRTYTMGDLVRHVSCNEWCVHLLMVLDSVVACSAWETNTHGPSSWACPWRERCSTSSCEKNHGCVRIFELECSL